MLVVGVFFASLFVCIFAVDFVGVVCFCFVRLCVFCCCFLVYLFPCCFFVLFCSGFGLFGLHLWSFVCFVFLMFFVLLLLLLLLLLLFYAGLFWWFVVVVVVIVLVFVFAQHWRLVVKWNKRNLVCGAECNIATQSGGTSRFLLRCVIEIKVPRHIAIETAPKASSQDRLQRLSLDTDKGCVQAQAFFLSKTKRMKELSSVLHCIVKLNPVRNLSILVLCD